MEKSHELAGIAFERETSRRLAALGWKVETTATTGDFGADLIARLGNDVLAVQCKDYGMPAGVASVQEAHFARTHYSAQQAMVVARNGFTRAATQAAASAGVFIITPADLSPGGAWDRTALKAKLDENRLSAEHARAASELLKRRSASWRSYDEALAAFTQQARSRPQARGLVLLGAVTCVGLAILHNQILWYAPATYLAYVLKKPLSAKPIPPDEQRREAIRYCDICGQGLRLELGRHGRVTCPKCKFLSGYAT